MSVQASNADEWADRLGVVQSSVVEVLATGPTQNGKNFNNEFGSGFMVYSDDILQETFLITAAHVINPPDGWADKPNEPGPDRKIRIRSEKVGAQGQFVSLSDNASVVAEDVPGDFAVLAIPIQSAASTLPLAAVGSQLKVRATLGIAGFPAGKSYAARTLAVWEGLNESKSGFVLDGVAALGQSGGPVIDEGGRAVALISQNDDRATPKFHHAVIVSQPLDLLNSYLQKRGRPLVPLVDSSSSKSRFRVVQRVGQGTVSLTGDSGELAKGKRESAGPNESAELSATGEGNEKSDCIDSMGRWNSSATGSFSVQPFELSGIKLRLAAAAKGGHFTNALVCLEGTPVGFVGKDTNASSKVSAEASIIFETTSTPFDLRIVWRDLFPDAQLQLLDPSSLVEAEIVPSDGNSERIARIENKGKWQLRLRTNLVAQAAGAENFIVPAHQPLVFLETK